MYTVEKIEDNLVTLEDRKTKEYINIGINDLDNNIKENDIVMYDNIKNKYIKNIDETKRIKKNLRDKFDKLKK